jgi:hypothetical protein
MKKLLLITLAFVSLSATAQSTCTPIPVTNCPYPETYCYLILSNAFVNKYQIQKTTKVGVNQFNAVQTNEGCWVTSCNALNEFPDIFLDTIGNNPTHSFQSIYLNRCSFTGTGGGTTTLTVNTQAPKQKPANRIAEPMKTFAIVKK